VIGPRPLVSPRLYFDSRCLYFFEGRSLPSYAPGSPLFESSPLSSPQFTTKAVFDVPGKQISFLLRLCTTFTVIKLFFLP